MEDSLATAISHAQLASNVVLDSPAARVEPGEVGLSRVQLVDAALAALAQGTPPRADAGVLDMLSSWLLSAVVSGDLIGVEGAQEQAQRLAAEVLKRAPAAETSGSDAFAEASGALGTLLWMSRLAAEALIGPHVISADTYAGKMLRVIEKYPNATNKVLAAELGTDKTEVSRVGRKLLDAGLAAVSRLGTTNSWRVTAKGSAVLRSMEPTAAFEPSARGQDATLKIEVTREHAAAPTAAKSVKVAAPSKTWAANTLGVKGTPPLKKRVHRRKCYDVNAEIDRRRRRTSVAASHQVQETLVVHSGRVVGASGNTHKGVLNDVHVALGGLKCGGTVIVEGKSDGTAEVRVPGRFGNGVQVSTEADGIASGSRKLVDVGGGTLLFRPAVMKPAVTNLYEVESGGPPRRRKR